MKHFASIYSWGHTTVRLGLFCFAVGCGSIASAQTDITIGGDARAFAMGGAGIAIMQKNDGSRLNPASIAFEKRSFDFRIPSVAVRSENDVGIGKVYSYLIGGKLKSGNIGDINDIAKEFGSQDTVFGVNANTSLRFAMIEVAGMGVARGKLLSNDSLRNWVNSGRLDSIPNDARADIIAAGYYNLPAVSVGLPLPAVAESKSRYAVGIRLKAMHAYYSHFIADKNALEGHGDSFHAPELAAANRDYLDKTGFGADLGLLMQPKAGPSSGLSAGLVIANAIKPSLTFDGTDRNGNPTTYDLVKTTASAGVGWQKKGFTVVADLVDITASTGPAQLRFGGEVAFPLNLAVRGGYSSGHGFSYGFDLFGINVAFAQRQPLEVVKTLNF